MRVSSGSNSDPLDFYATSSSIAFKVFPCRVLLCSQTDISEQHPAKAGGVVAPKPPHSLNSSAVLHPEPPVLVSESHSGHCTDFLKVRAHFCVFLTSALR